MEGKKIEFADLQIKLELPVKLSDNEKEKISAIFGNLNTIMGELKTEILDMDRDDAYRYMQTLLQKFVEAKGLFEEGKAPSLENRKVIPKHTAASVEIKPAGYFMKIFKQLTSHQKSIAKKSLDCVKTALNLIESGEAPQEQVLCPECDLETMRNCISTEDPNVKDEMDEDLKAARAR